MKLGIFKKNKWIMLGASGLILLSSLLFYDNRVFSLFTNIERNIIFNDDRWDMNTKFDQQWLTNENSVSFIVDLSDDYKNKFTETPAEPVQRPFTITAAEGIVVPEPTPLTGGSGFTGQYQVTVPLNQDGQLDLQLVIPEENSWGAPQAIEEFSVTRDATEPTVVLSGIENGALTTEDVAIMLEIVDEHFTPNNVEIVVTQNGESQSVTPQWSNKAGEYQSPLRFTGDGEYEISVTAVDQAGNTSEQKSTSFAIRKSGPEMNLTQAGNDIIMGGHYPGGSVEVAVQSRIKIENAEVTIKKPDNTVETKPLTISKNGREATLDGGYAFAADGEYEITAHVKERHAKGESYDLKAVDFTVDRKAPELRITGVENEQNYRESQEIVVTATELNLANGDVTVTRKDFNGQETSENYPLKDGKAVFSVDRDGVYVLLVKATDKAGNIAEQQLSFTIDRQEPNVWLSEDVDGKYFNNNKKLTISVQDFTLKTAPVLKVTKDGSEYLTEELDRLFFRYWKDIKFSSDGVYELNVSTIDFFNRETNVGPITFTIDQTAPVVEITNVENGALYNTPQYVQISADDANFVLETTKLNVTRNGAPYLDAVGEKALGTHTVEKDGVYSVELETTDKAGNKAVHVPIEFTIDQTAPKLAILGVKNDDHYPPKDDVTLSVEDLTLDLKETKVEVTKNSVQQDLGNLKWEQTRTEDGLKKATVTLPFKDEGDYQIHFSSKERKTGMEEKLETKFTIDATAPVIEVEGIQQGQFVKQGESVKIKVTEANFADNTVKIMATKDGKPYEFGKWENSGEVSQLSHKFNVDGDYEIKVEATDKAGHRADAQTLSFTVDELKPEITISKADLYKNKAQKVTISVTEHNFKNNKVIIQVTQNLDGNEKPFAIGEWHNTAETSELSHSFNEDGNYSITVTSKDAAGNIADAKTTVFTIDQIAPVLSISGVEHGEDYKSDQLVSIKASDRNIDLSETNLSVTRNGKPFSIGKLRLKNATTAELGYTFKEEGSYDIELKTTDKAGNGTKHERIAFIVDKTTPVVRMDGVEDGSFNPTAKNVTIAVDELNFGTNNVSVAATKDGQALPIGTWKNTARISKLGYNFNRDGLYTLSVSALDKAGNGPASKKSTFTIDTVKPAIEISGVENNAHYNTDKPVRVEIRDVNLDKNSVMVTRNGQHYNLGGFAVNGNLATLSHHFSQEGEYHIIVEAEDKAGNSYSNQIAFTIDKTNPVITPKFKGENTVIKNGDYINQVFTPEFALDQREDRIVSVTLNGGANIGTKIPAASREMKYTYKVLARDKAGNEATIDISFTLDTTKPALNITGVLDGFFNENIAPRVTYSDIHLDSSRSSVTLNGQPFGNGARLEAEQDYVLKAVVTDLANNVSSRTLVFTIDKTSPVIKFKEPISNKYFNEDFIPELLIEDLNAYDIIALMLNGKPYELGDPIKDEGKHVLFFEVKDSAGNIQQMSVEFILDKTMPKVIFDGVKEQTKYRDPVTVSIRLYNPEDVIKSVSINGELFDGEVVEENGQQVMKTTLTDVNSYEIEVTAYDEAGNEIVTAIPFEIVEKGALVKLYENKPLFAGTIAGLLGAVGAAVVVMLKRRKPGAEE